MNAFWTVPAGQRSERFSRRAKLIPELVWYWHDIIEHHWGVKRHPNHSNPLIITNNYSWIPWQHTSWHPGPDSSCTGRTIEIDFAQHHSWWYDMCNSWPNTRVSTQKNTAAQLQRGRNIAVAQLTILPRTWKQRGVGWYYVIKTMPKVPFSVGFFSLTVFLTLSLSLTDLGNICARKIQSKGSIYEFGPTT